MLLAGGSVDAINATAALLGSLGTLLGASVSVYTLRELIRSRKFRNNGNGGGSSDQPDGGQE